MIICYCSDITMKNTKEICSFFCVFLMEGGKLVKEEQKVIVGLYPRVSTEDQ